MSKSKRGASQEWLSEEEREWLEADNPHHFHDAMGGAVKVSARRMRLAAVAGMRACGRRLTPVQEAAARAAELFADGGIGIDALKSAETAVKPGRDDFATRIAQLCHRQASYALGGPTAALTAGYDPGHRFTEREDAERARPVMAVFRDVFGNPFRKVEFRKAWRTAAVTALAAAAYEQKVFDGLPVLADALEEAGCDAPAVLAHCRDPQAVHVRGCWVLDLVLGKK